MKPTNVLGRSAVLFCCSRPQPVSANHCKSPAKPAFTLIGPLTKEGFENRQMRDLKIGVSRPSALCRFITLVRGSPGSQKAIAQGSVVPNTDDQVTTRFSDPSVSNTKRDRNNVTDRQSTNSSYVQVCSSGKHSSSAPCSGKFSRSAARIRDRREPGPKRWATGTCSRRYAIHNQHQRI